MMLSILAAAMARDEACALVDGHDSFSPGIHSGKFLWVRCHNLTQALKSTDLLLQGGGFGVVALDVSDLDAKALQEVPLSTWFRFQRSLKTPTIHHRQPERNRKTRASLPIPFTGKLKTGCWRTPSRWPKSSGFASTPD